MLAFAGCNIIAAERTYHRLAIYGVTAVSAFLCIAILLFHNALLALGVSSQFSSISNFTPRHWLSASVPLILSLAAFIHL